MGVVNRCIVKKRIADLGIDYRYTIYHLVHIEQLTFYFINGLGELNI